MTRKPTAPAPIDPNDIPFDELLNDAAGGGVHALSTPPAAVPPSPAAAGEGAEHLTGWRRLDAALLRYHDGQTEQDDIDVLSLACPQKEMLERETRRVARVRELRQRAGGRAKLHELQQTAERVGTESTAERQELEAELTEVQQRVQRRLREIKRAELSAKAAANSMQSAQAELRRLVPPMFLKSYHTAHQALRNSQEYQAYLALHTQVGQLRSLLTYRQTAGSDFYQRVSEWKPTHPGYIGPDLQMRRGGEVGNRLTPNHALINQRWETKLVEIQHKLPALETEHARLKAEVDSAENDLQNFYLDIYLSA